MRILTTTRSLAVIVAAVVALAGCGAGGEPEPSEVPDSVLSAVTWTGGPLDEPTIAFDAQLTITTSEALVVNAGDGDPIGSGDIITINFQVVNALSGQVEFSSWELGAPESLSLSDGSLDPVINAVLVDQNVGVQFLYASPGSVDPLTGELASVIMAVTVVGTTTVLDRAEGEAIVPPPGLPGVVLDSTGYPTVEIPEGEQPTEFVSQVLILGDGPELTEGQSLRAHYTGWLWDGEPFDSSWDRGTPLTITVAPGFVIQGWVDGLVGVPVGSQVLLIIPAELGYGDTGQGQIPPGATLVFVVDILAAS